MNNRNIELIKNLKDTQEALIKLEANNKIIADILLCQEKDYSKLISTFQSSIQNKVLLKQQEVNKIKNNIRNMEKELYSNFISDFCEALEHISIGSLKMAPSTGKEKGIYVLASLFLSLFVGSIIKGTFFPIFLLSIIILFIQSNNKKNISSTKSNENIHIKNLNNEIEKLNKDIRELELEALNYKTNLEEKINVLRSKNFELILNKSALDEKRLHDLQTLSKENRNYEVIVNNARPNKDYCKKEIIDKLLFYLENEIVYELGDATKKYMEDLQREHTEQAEKERREEEYRRLEELRNEEHLRTMEIREKELAATKYLKELEVEVTKTLESEKLELAYQMNQISDNVAKSKIEWLNGKKSINEDDIAKLTARLADLNAIVNMNYSDKKEMNEINDKLNELYDLRIQIDNKIRLIYSEKSNMI